MQEDEKLLMYYNVARTRTRMRYPRPPSICQCRCKDRRRFGADALVGRSRPALQTGGCARTARPWQRSPPLLLTTAGCGRLRSTRLPNSEGPPSSLVQLRAADPHATLVTQHLEQISGAHEFLARIAEKWQIVTANRAPYTGKNLRVARHIVRTGTYNGHAGPVTSRAR
jgi:hypothetical protein